MSKVCQNTHEIKGHKLWSIEFFYACNLFYKLTSINCNDEINKAKKNICVFTVTCQKNLGSVGRD